MTAMSRTEPEIKALQDSLYRSQVVRARQTPIAEKLSAGAILFDEAARTTRDGIRTQNPEFSEAEVEQEFRRRLAIARKLDEGDIYRDAGFVDE